MSRRIPLKRPVAIATTQPLPRSMAGSLWALLAAAAFFVNPLLGLGIVGFALWQSLAD